MSVTETLYISSYIYKQVIKKQKCNIVDIFALKIIPNISIEEYLNRIINFYKNVDIDLLICAMIYMKRYLEYSGSFLYENNVHCIVFISIVIADKMFNDYYCDNKWLANLGGIELKHLNNMEIEFLTQIGFRCYIHKNEFDDMKNEIHNT